MTADRETRATRAGKWLLAAVVPGSVMAIGSLHTTTLIIVSLLAATSCVLLWLDPPKRTSRASRWVLIAFGILMGATILQAIPLPAGLVSVIAPANADVWARALAPLREPGPSWHPISVAPPATHVEILKGALYGCVFLAALRVTFSDGGTRFLETVVIGSAALVAITSLAHAAVEAHRVYGFYEPHDSLGFEAGRRGPLLNPNHLAAYLNVGALTAMGVVIRERREAVIVAVGLAAVVLLAGTSVWAASRGGTGSLVVGVVLVAALSYAARRARGRGAEIMVVAGALTVAGGLFGVGASDVARADLAATDMSKLDLARTAMRLVPASPLFGWGRGAFDSTFLVVREGPNYMSFRAAENVIVQWLVEWGGPFAVAAAAALAIALRPATLFVAARPPVGAWVGIVVLVVHDLVDFHLEIPGVVVPGAVCMAIVVGSRAASRARRESSASDRGRSRVRLSLRAAARAVAAATLVACGFAAFAIGHSLVEERDAIAKVVVDADAGPRDVRDALRAAMLRYPAEPFFPLAGAIHAQATGTESVVPWISRALERYPAFGRAHLVLARSLARRNPAQARLEYRLAYRWDTLVRGSVTTEGQRLVDGFDSALELVPEDAHGVELLESLAVSVAPRLPATSARLDEELSRRSPGAPGPLKRRVEGVALDLRFDHAWCSDKPACAKPAIEAARALVAGPEGARCEAHVLLAKVRIAAGDVAGALDDLGRAAEVTTDRATCFQALVQLSLEVGDKRRADQALDTATRAGCGSRDDCVQLYTWAASTEAARGNTVRAISFYKRAADLTPESDTNLQRVAELAEHAGLTGEALDAYGKLRLRHPDDNRWRSRAEALRKAANERRLQPPR